MQFSKTIDAVLSGRKTQTRRKVPKDCTVGMNDRRDVVAVYGGGRAVWRVGETYAVQRGRGKPAEGRIRLTAIRRQAVRDITPEDAAAEGVLFATDDRIEAAGLMPALLAIRDARRHPKFCGWRFADVGGFALTWEMMHGHGSFVRDECFALTFELVRGGRGNGTTTGADA